MIKLIATYYYTIYNNYYWFILFFHIIIVIICATIIVIVVFIKFCKNIKESRFCNNKYKHIDDIDSLDVSGRNSKKQENCIKIYRVKCIYNITLNRWNIYIYICMCARVCVYVCVHACVIYTYYTYIHIHIPSYIHIHTHVRAHAYTYQQILQNDLPFLLSQHKVWQSKNNHF